ncbi:MAG: zinc ribbon domain-containing protein, partial [Lachnospiraceae bacterium]|nr:zinc ribbon domain-containing protein [Lachnospiraceae bacterium]
MICRKCGGEVKEGSIFCSHCGVRLQEAAGVGQEAAEVKTEGQAETAVPEETAGEAVDVKTAAQKENVEETLDMPEFEMAEQKRPEEPEQRAEQPRQPEAAPVTAAAAPVTGAEDSGAVSPTAANTPAAAAAAVPPETVKSEKPKGKKKKKVVIVGIAVTAVIVAAVLLAATLFSGGSGKWDVYGKDVIYCIRSDDEIKILNVASGKVTKGPDISDVRRSENSIDAAKQYLLGRNDGLYMVSGNNWSEVTDEAYTAAMCVSGDGIIYLAVNDDEYEMYLYDTAKKKSALVAEGLSRNIYAVVSADGKSVAYMDEKNSRCHLYINGNEQEDTIKGAYPGALSSGGKYFYYIRNSSFY